MFTIHNIAYQGMFARDVMHLTGLPGWLFNHNQLEFHGHFNFLKAGIVFADAVNTVSPTYAREIQTAEFGCGLEGLLAGVRGKLSGIVNGCDYGHWDPATDRTSRRSYTPETVFEHKPLCKADLQRRFDLPEDPNAPVLGMVARLVTQKGIDLVMSAAPGFLDLGCQIVVLGEGDREYHDQLPGLPRQAPGPRRHLPRLQRGAGPRRSRPGADLFLMPSRYEPCGLNQLYSLRYGTPPVVRNDGRARGHGRERDGGEPRRRPRDRLRLPRLHAGCALRDGEVGPELIATARPTSGRWSRPRWSRTGAGTAAPLRTRRLYRKVMG